MGKGERREPLFSITLADCVLQTFQAGGPGGQHQNHSNTAVRITHPPSGAVGISREERSQLLNKKKAWRRMAEHPKMTAWIQKRAAWGGDPEEQVKRAMAPKNLLIYGVKENGD